MSLLFCKVVITEIARICSQLYLVDSQWVHVHLVDIEFPEDVAGTLTTWAWGGPHPRLVISATATNVQLFPVSCPALGDRSERLW